MSDEPPTTTWAEVPVATSEGPVAWGTSILTTIVAVVVGPLGPFVRTLMIAPAPGPVVVGGVGIAGLAAMRATPRAAWPARLGIAVAAGAATAPWGGRWAGVWMLAGLMLAAWLAMDRPPTARFPPLPSDLWPPLTAIALGGTWLGRRVEATWAPLVVVGGSVVLIVAHLWLGDRFARASAWVAHHVEKGLATLLLAPLWMITTLLPWCLHRVLVVDPLAAPLSPAGTIALRRTTGRPHLLWEGRHWTDRLPWFARVRQRLAMPLGALLVVAVAISAPSVPTPAQPADAAPVPAAVADAPWWPEHVKIANWYLGNGVDPVRYRRQRDIASPTINVENGQRSTWSPPPCRCPRLEVWMYGGSTTFGLGQRDDHTIPSELARRARADGIDLHVVNRGVIGDTHWAESLRFTWDSEVESKPDLVVFLDGYNELLSSRTLNETGRADGPDPADPTLDAVQRRNDPLADPDHGLPATPDGIELDGLPQGATLGPVPLGRATAGRYQRSLSVSAAAAHRTGIPTVWFWQPTRATRNHPSDQPPVTDHDDAEEQAKRRSSEAARAELDERVVDVSDALDQVDGPLFYDDVHLNERGARLMAEELYDHLRPTVLAATSS